MTDIRPEVQATILTLKVGDTVRFNLSYKANNVVEEEVVCGTEDNRDSTAGMAVFQAWTANGTLFESGPDAMQIFIPSTLEVVA